MHRAIETHGISFGDFCVLVSDGQKADLIDGVICMASPDNTAANDIEGFLLVLLRHLVEEKGFGKVYVSRVAFRIDKRNAPEPDIAFVKKERKRLVKRGYVDGPPDLAIEIVSPDSVERDYKTKRKLYQGAGVEEYWIVDEIKRKVVLLRLAATGFYRVIKPRKGILASETIRGFWIRPEWLWQDPLPSTLQTIQTTLQNPGGTPNPEEP